MIKHQKATLLSMRPGHKAGAGCSCGWHSHSKTFEEHWAEALREAIQDDEIVRAFKTAWEEADARGATGSRVRAGLEAVADALAGVEK